MNPTGPDEYTENEIQRLLAEDPAIAEQGIITTVRGDTLVLCGDVESAQRRRDIERLVAERFPNARIRCDIGVIRAGTPSEEEELG